MQKLKISEISHQSGFIIALANIINSGESSNLKELREKVQSKEGFYAWRGNSIANCVALIDATAALMQSKS